MESLAAWLEFKVIHNSPSKIVSPLFPPEDAFKDAFNIGVVNYKGLEACLLAHNAQRPVIIERPPSKHSPADFASRVSDDVVQICVMQVDVQVAHF